MKAARCAVCKEKSEAEALAKQFDGLEVKFPAQVRRGRSFVWIGYGCDIAEALGRRASTLIDGRFSCTSRSRALGVIIRSKLHKDVTTHLKVVVDKKQ